MLGFFSFWMIFTWARVCLLMFLMFSPFLPMMKPMRLLLRASFRTMILLSYALERGRREIRRCPPRCPS